MGQSVKGMFSSSTDDTIHEGLTKMTLETAVFISGVLCFFVLLFVRHVSESSTLCFINLIMLMAALVLSLGSLITKGRGDDSNDDANNLGVVDNGRVDTQFVADLSFSNFFQASTNILYAYAGHWMVSAIYQVSS